MDPILEALKEFQDSLGELASECEKLADELQRIAIRGVDVMDELAGEGRPLL
jgi:hypothetical protein